MKLTQWIAAALITACVPMAAFANKIMTPESLDGVRVVTAEQVQAAMGKGAPAFDVRVTAECSEKTIKGAVCHVYREKSAKRRTSTRPRTSSIWPSCRRTRARR